jgi:hypothetical protein
MHLGLPILSKTAAKAISVSAHKIQRALLENGDRYDIRDLNDVLAQWLESCVEELAEEACELCVTGDRTYGGFNRQVFEDLLAKIPIETIPEFRATPQKAIAA